MLSNEIRTVVRRVVMSIVISICCTHCQQKRGELSSHSIEHHSLKIELSNLESTTSVSKVHVWNLVIWSALIQTTLFCIRWATVLLRQLSNYKRTKRRPIKKAYCKFNCFHFSYRYYNLNYLPGFFSAYTSNFFSRMMIANYNLFNRKIPFSCTCSNCKSNSLALIKITKIH